MNKVSSSKNLNKENLKAVAKLWQINLKKLHKEIPIQGSPERSLFRVVLENDEGKYFVIEKIPVKSVQRKKNYCRDT